MSKLKQVVQAARAGVFQASKHALEQVEEKTHELSVYLESEEFESDLDDLGKRLDIGGLKIHNEESDREIRVRRKLHTTTRHCRDDILSAMKEGLAIALPTRIPQLMVGLPLAFGTAKSTVIGYHCYQVFLARKRLTVTVEAS